MADHDLLITTPYFVLDESLQRALISAARRGVKATLVVPQRVDSRMVRLANRPFLRQLAAAGVIVAEYHAGMPHTKSITIDCDTSYFGSLNLVPRSLELNFELMLVIYDETFTRDLIALRQIGGLLTKTGHSFYSLASKSFASVASIGRASHS